MTRSGVPRVVPLLCVALVCLSTEGAAQIPGYPSALDVWLEDARSSDPKDRLGAMTYGINNALTSDATVRGRIILALGDESPDVREAAAFALADMPLNPHEESALGDAKDQRVGGALAYAIGRRKIATATPDPATPRLAPRDVRLLSRCLPAPATIPIPGTSTSVTISPTSSRPRSVAGDGWQSGRSPSSPESRTAAPTAS